MNDYKYLYLKYKKKYLNLQNIINGGGEMNIKYDGKWNKDIYGNNEYIGDIINDNVYATFTLPSQTTMNINSLKISNASLINNFYKFRLITYYI